MYTQLHMSNYVLTDPKITNCLMANLTAQFVDIYPGDTHFPPHTQSVPQRYVCVERNVWRAVAAADTRFIWLGFYSLT